MTDVYQFLRQLLDCTAGLSLSRIPLTPEALLSLIQEKTGHIFDSLLEQNAAYWQGLLQTPARADTIYEYFAIGGITFLVYVHSESSSAYFLGPALTRPHSKEEALRAMQKYPLSNEAKGQFLQYCEALPVMESHTLYRAGDLVFGRLSGSETPLRLAQANSVSVADTLYHADTPLGREHIAQMRTVETRYEYSATLTDAVKQGNLSLALHIIGQYSPAQNTTVRNANPLRNAQNYCIVLNTQLRHALEESGIHPYRVDQLSNDVGLEIEQLKSLSQIPAFFKQVIRRYCRLVQEHAYPHLKPLTNLTVTYIKEHLTENLTVKDTAKALTINANYLSTLFHREIGMTFIDFVNKERTSQAAALLTHTNLQVQQIASAVGYNNTSYFAKQFVRFQGVSPSQYRRGEK